MSEGKWLPLVTVLATLLLARVARGDMVMRATSPATKARGNAAVSLLNDGRVLRTGGTVKDAGEFGPTTAECEVFEPKTETWSTTTPMLVARREHVMTTLRDGRVLVTGGLNGDGIQPSAELYDPSTNTWTLAGETQHPAWSPSPFVLLTDGRAAVVVGINGGLPKTLLQIFDPSTRGWTSATTIHQHYNTVLAPLADGGALLLSGTFAERYHPSSGFRAIASPPEDRTAAGSVTLHDGRVLIAGGSWTAAGPVLFDPETDTWQNVSGLPRAHGSSAAVLADGRVLIAGGPFDPNPALTIEIFDPATMEVLPLVVQPTHLVYHSVVALSDGRAMIFDLAGGAYLITPPRSCRSAADCPDSVCADGFCCNNACEGRCEACDVAYHLGTCSAVQGTPHGSRPACTTPRTSTCGELTCDGTRDRNACTASGAECTSVGGLRCSTPSTSPSPRPRALDALLVVAFAAVFERTRRTRRTSRSAAPRATRRTARDRCAER